MPAQELLRREQEGVGEQPEASEAAAAAAVDGARRGRRSADDAGYAHMRRECFFS